jgi:integrase
MKRRREWHGSIYADQHGRLTLQVRIDGKWRKRSTGLLDTPNNRALAEERLAGLVAALKARESVMGEDESGPVTVRAWAKRWLQRRQGADKANDEARLRLHVLPVIGAFELAQVRPRHIIELVNAVKVGHAPRTVRNVYSVTKAMFRDAALHDLMPAAANPCILGSRELGKVRDRVPSWRAGAQFTREELAQLIFTDSIPQPRRVLYALLGVECLRAGEACGLRWSSVELGFETLGRLAITTSYDTGRTKTDTSRYMPVHPSVRSLLNEWKLGGWARTYDRVPEPTDLVVPTPPEPRRKGRIREVGAMLDDGWVWKRLRRDCDALGISRRRTHDLRRTGITLYIADGADSNLLKRGTHAPPRSVMDLYTSVEWKVLCREIAKLKLPRPADSATLVPADARTSSENGGM